MNAVLIQKPKDYIGAVNGFASFFQRDSETVGKAKYCFKLADWNAWYHSWHFNSLICSFLFALAVDTVN